MEKATVAAILREMATLLELRGENPFRARAYLKAARSIETLEEDLTEVVRADRLMEIDGVGETLSHQIKELVQTGKLHAYEELKSSIPPGHLEMLRIPGLGPRKIKTLFETLDIKSVGELEYACLENRLIELPGFGRKTQEKILQGIQQIKKYQGRHLYGEVIESAEDLLRKILLHPKTIRASIAGSLRRRMEVVGNINLVVSTPEPEQIFAAFSEFPEVETARLIGGLSGRFALLTGLEVDLKATSDSAFPFLLLRQTGSRSHWEAVCEKANSFGFTLRETGLERNGRPIPCREEAGIFEALGLSPIPPELREGQGEIDAAEAHRLPVLIEGADIKGVFHVHSLYSDGTSSLKAMARAAKEMGLLYIGISDHSQRARYAGGLNPEQLRSQWEEIDHLNREMEGFHLFKGIEADILPDGSLDYDASILECFDFVIASVHSHFTMTREEMTRRIIKAIRNPFTTILGHPTGRLLLAREPYPVDMFQVIEEAAQRGVAIELNSHPFRLDIDWRLCKYAKEKGVKIAINPDAHEEKGLRDIRFGVGIARKGWLGPGDVLNTLDAQEMKAFLEVKRKSVRGC